ncbi:RHS repeat-associated core domain-containing protein [Pseudomonas sp. CAM1A]|uniref:RHS repeat-associated core domain-containing protein n=1 Tax=Pseudomonas sp. CAM1A TaxID=3231717 RepID=UPI0039C5FEA3
MISNALLQKTDRLRSTLSSLSGSAYTVYGFQKSPPALLGFAGQLGERSLNGYALGNGHRFYNPSLMRFLSPDALSPFAQGGINGYAYCGLDPVNHVDPDGRQFYSVAKNNLMTAKIFMEGIYVFQKIVKRFITGSEAPWYEPKKFGEYVSYTFKATAVGLTAISELVSNLPGPTTPGEQASHDGLMNTSDNLKGTAAVFSLAATGVEIIIAGVDIFQAIQKKRQADLSRATEMLRQAGDNVDLLRTL